MKKVLIILVAIVAAVAGLATWSAHRPRLTRLGQPPLHSLMPQNDQVLRVLVVWEPILPTDSERPITSVPSRIHKPGVAQFWDHDHLVAEEISRQLASDPAGPKPRCCTRRGNLWGLAALYPKGGSWEATAPKAVFADGPVVAVQPNLSCELSGVLNQEKLVRVPNP